MATDWLSYQNQNATRNQPLAPRLVEAMSFLPEMGVTMRVVSGGQDATGPNRVGSTRHDHGNAGDVDFYRNGKKLDWNNASDLPILSNIVAQARANGVTGIGAGDDYMGAGRFHIGFGSPGVWGAGGRAANAPGWLTAAYNGAPVPPRNIPNAAATPALNAINRAAPQAQANNAWSNPLGFLKTATAGLTAPVAQLASSPQVQQAAIGPLMGTLAGRTMIGKHLMGMNIGDAPSVSQGHSGAGTRAMAVSSGGAVPVTLTSRGGGSGGRGSFDVNSHMNMDIYRANAEVLGGSGFTQDNINNALSRGETLYRLA